MPHFDIGYFKKNVNRKKISDVRKIKNRYLAWKLDREYYDGQRKNGYGGFFYDGRWKKLLPKIINKYKLTNKSKVLDVGCKKGFLIYDLSILLPGIKCYGLENHSYPLQKTIFKNKKNLFLLPYHDLGKFKKNYFDFVIAFNSIYMQNLGDTIKTLEEISRISKSSYVSLASYEKKIDRDKFLDWTLLGTSILKKTEWRRLFKIIDYKGDYYFSDAKALNL